MGKLEKEQSRLEPWRVQCAPLRITLIKETGPPSVCFSGDIWLLRCREGRQLGSNTAGLCPVTPSQGHFRHKEPWNRS